MAGYCCCNCRHEEKQMVEKDYVGVLKPPMAPPRMTRVAILLLKSELRDPPVLFWDFAFPIILMTVLGLIYFGTGWKPIGALGGETRIKAYGYALDEWERWCWQG